jgi:hypothetical protein
MTMPQAVISGDLIEIALELEQVAEIRQRRGTRDYDTPRECRCSARPEAIALD